MYYKIHKWTIWQQMVHKTTAKGTQDDGKGYTRRLQRKQKHNTQCVGHHYGQTTCIFDHVLF